MDEKRYLIDDEPASAQDIIRRAKELDDDYGSDGIYQTSFAARILRLNGNVIKDNPNYTPKGDKR